MASTDSLYQLFLNHPTVCTDTRNIIKNSMFFALKGDKFDANAFAAQALLLGAAYAIIDNEAYQTDERCILVPDVLNTLQELAKQHRSQLQIPVIGLTGSNGKTTTKELINAVLSQRFRTFATKGNLNNHIGVPLSILALNSETEIAVIEMGANHQGEIAMLCNIAQPTHGLITNVGMAHLEGFGGFEGVKKGKAELFAYLKEHNGLVFLNRDNLDLMEMSKKTDLSNIVFYGSKSDNAAYGHLIKSDPLIELSWANKARSFNTSVQLTGAYNFENILAAICIGQFFQVTPEQINTGLEGYLPKNNRSQITKTATNTIICDFYNANPSSMEAALKNIERLSSDNKTIIIGDMFELGQESEDQHKHILEEAEKLSINTRIYIGTAFCQARKSHKGLFFPTPKDAETFLKANPILNSLVLLKGSRGMALEQLLPLL